MKNTLFNQNILLFNLSGKSLHLNPNGQLFLKIFLLGIQEFGLGAQLFGFGCHAHHRLVT